MEDALTSTCLACGSATTRRILDFGRQPAANLLSDEPHSDVRRETLALRFCDSCGHAQQDSFYSHDALFDHYLYQSGTSGTLRDFFDWLAGNVARSAPAQAAVLEIASNDGSFLQALAKAGIEATGLEPARNLVDLAQKRGLNVIAGFWPQARPRRDFDRIVGLNVLAHNPDPLGFLRAVRESLAPQGLAYIQVSQADMFRNFEFDTLYHEHYSFFCPNSLSVLAARAGFSAARFCKTAVHGGSILGLFGTSEGSVDEALAPLLAGPFALGILRNDDRPSSPQADLFQTRAREICASIAALGKLAREGGRKFVLVGAAAKAITVLQASGVSIDHVVDEAPLKIGKYIPGTDVRIQSLADVDKISGTALFLIGAWNFRSELEGKLRLRRPGGDLAAVYFPSLALAEL